MAEKTKKYRAKFPSEVIKNAHKEFHKRVGRGAKLERSKWDIKNKKDETWRLDSEDDFFINYQDEVKNAEISYSYYKDSNIYTFSIDYKQSNYDGTSTSISISLPVRSDIELLFSLFDQVEEKYRIANTPTVNNVINSDETLYAIKRPLPACHVDRKLFSDLEKYLLRKATVLEEIASDTKWKYRLTINDTFGSEDLPSIENFKLSIFPDDTKSITISVGSFASSEISLSFNLGREYSILKISLKSENSRLVVEGIAAEIFQILNAYKTRNGFFHPSFGVESIIQIALWTLLSSAAIIMLGKQSIQIATSLLIMSLMIGVYFLFKKYKPYSTFDSRQNQRREQWSSWLMFTVLEFIFFTIIGGLVLREVFGF